MGSELRVLEKNSEKKDARIDYGDLLMFTDRVKKWHKDFKEFEGEIVILTYKGLVSLSNPAHNIELDYRYSDYDQVCSMVSIGTLVKLPKGTCVQLTQK